MEIYIFEWKEPPAEPLEFQDYPDYGTIEEYQIAYGPKGTERDKIFFGATLLDNIKSAINDTLKYAGYPPDILNLQLPTNKDSYAEKRFKIFDQSYRQWLDCVAKKCDLLDRNDVYKVGVMHYLKTFYPNCCETLKNSSKSRPKPKSAKHQPSYVEF